MKAFSYNFIRFILLFTLIISSLSMKADKIDSLIVELNKVSYEKKTDVLLQLSEIYRNKSLDTAKMYAKQALQIALNENDKHKIALFYNELGIICIYEGNTKDALTYTNKGLEVIDNKDEKLLYNLILNKGSALVYSGNLDEGLILFNQALEYHKKKNDSLKVSDIYNNIGVINFHKGEYEKAMENMLTAVEIYEKKGMYSTAADTYGNIAMIYNETDNFKKAVEYNLKALNTYIKSNDYHEQAGQLINLANIYKNADSLDRSKFYLQRALLIAKKNNYSGLEALAYANLGLTYEKQGLYDKATKVLKKSLEINKKAENAESQAKNLRILGSVLKKQKKYNSALQYLNESEELAKKIKLVSEYYDIYSEKSEVYEALKDYKKSLEYFRKYTNIKDSIFNEEKNRQITEIETKYLTEQKEKEIIKLSDENGKQKLIILKNRYFTYSLIAFIVIILLFGILLFRNNKIKNRQKTLELEQKLFRSQMNPHFIFNSLSSIQTYIMKNKAIEAGAFLADFAILMRLVLENSRAEYIPLEQEIETMKYYLQMQKLRFEYHFSYIFETDEGLETGDVLIPPMLTQPFIENALEHAFNKNKNENNLYIRYTEQNGFLQVEVEDNGIGRKKALSTKKSKHKSFAISLTKSRLGNLNRRKKNKINFEIIDLISETGNPSGTKVKFNIPLKNSD